MDAEIDRDIDVEKVAKVMLAAPLSQGLGLRLVGITPGTVTLEAPWREDLVGDAELEILAGGVVTALIDHACATTISSIKRGGAPTLDLRVDYMRPAAPRAGVVCEAHCYKLTRSIAFVRALAWDVDRDDPVATALATFAVPEPRA
ncbi:PaaI family thioesterase [Phenylobacterium sp. LjRoot219]|uniref:PaaI family thioesterase n=1 Tax=Phenylobacterium sp. LjRoot219 TaxID=3342283 RepID=UPI003ECD00AC